MSNTDYSELVNKMAKQVFLSPSEVYSVAKSACYRYKEYTIPKKNGGVRYIAQPSPPVKELQRWVIKNLLSSFPVHENAYAYQEKKNIYKNALKHKDSDFIWKTDFINFFPSIKSEDFINLLNINRLHIFTSEDLDLLVRILFKKSRKTCDYSLTIGSPSSPVLSNLVMYDFDNYISNYCAEIGLIYTRYADDITVSGNSAKGLTDVHSEILGYLSTNKSPNLSLNTKKTILVSKKYRRVVTGLIITNDGKISIGREKKRKIRSAIHHSILGVLESKDIQWLKGNLAFINDVEPNFLNSLKRKYGEEAVLLLLREN